MPTKIHVPGVEKEEKKDLAARPPLPEVNLEEKGEQAESGAEIAFAIPPGEYKAKQVFEVGEKLPGFNKFIKDGKEVQVGDEFSPRGALMAMPEEELPVTRGLLATEIRELETRLLTMLQSSVDELKQAPAIRSNGIPAVVIGGEFNCPKCGLRLSAPAKITQVGKQHPGLYEHPFDESPKLGGKKCILMGFKFKAPVIFLESTKPLPLTGEGQ